MSLLKKGDSIGIIAPSVGLKGKDLTPILSFFKSLGLKVLLADNLTKEYRYMAGIDKERATAINDMLKNQNIKALFCLRGGAGAIRILPYLNKKIIKENKKVIIGLSDSTALQNALIKINDNPSLTGFLPLYDIKTTINQTTKDSLLKALFDDNHLITSGTALIKGTAKGKLIGGCLSVFINLCGTPYFPDLTDKILILEDVGEKTYKIDIMLNQLKLQKNFNKLKAVIFGNFANCPISDPEDGTIDDCIRDFSKNLSIPVIKDFAYGHIPARHIVPLGIETILKAENNRCTLSWHS